MTSTRRTPKKRPKVLVPACTRRIDDQAYMVVGQKYLDAVELAGCQPWVFSGCTEDELDDVLTDVDGVMLTGSPSNIHPSRYGQSLLDPQSPLDPQRDAWVLPMIQRAVALGVPLLGICRGFQEINVALGGRLHQAVHNVSGLRDHRAPKDVDSEKIYGPAHPVHLRPEGCLSQMLATDSIVVNSIHEQGVCDLGPGLRVEAQAPDGLIEAFSGSESAGFLLAVQWHPEWRASGNPASRKLFEAFGAACSERCRERNTSASAMV